MASEVQYYQGEMLMKFATFYPAVLETVWPLSISLVVGTRLSPRVYNDRQASNPTSGKFKALYRMNECVDI
jgi:hypothetical protein